MIAKKGAELEAQNLKDCEAFNKTMKEIKEQWNKEHYQLIKAKELLKEWIICHGGTREFHSALQDKTETFLKENE